MDSQILGNTIVIPRRPSITPETYFQVLGETFKKTELTFISNVKRMTAAVSEPITVYALTFEPPATDPPIIIGRSGSMHGACTVRTPAKKEIVKNRSLSILLMLLNYDRQAL